MVDESVEIQNRVLELAIFLSSCLPAKIKPQTEIETVVK
jgi:hypothetical protein